MTSTLFTAAIFLALSSEGADAAFGVSRVHTMRSSTSLNLEDSVADMIDQALYKQSHKKEIEDQFQKKQQAVAEVSIPQGFDFDESDIMENISHIQQRRDRLLAKRNPQAYCADRCVATGNCDVFEDIFKFSPQEVMAFCEECVLSEDEEPCDVPDSFHDHFMSLKP
jgi:hypothetical protein|uniref:Uncharacterized protein n=1 Tax=Attheya septentrionalis TaxID=420275 RepID=A0A7S2UM05_9STRA|mmetsp:Transcript_29030/g.53121  ORF Transcript_29030/g.53121 Transcript_29030/m.53121 type:complete len:167 (+) Transcript_29030:185-685(+)